jgi:hypothetical protein
VSLIRTTEELAQVRSADLGGSALLKKILAVVGAILLRLPVGVGKSTAVDDLVEHILALGSAYDLIIICAPTHRILGERAVLSNPEYQAVTRRLRGRPHDECGERRNKEWQRYEKSASTTLGKNLICGRCERRSQCPWQDQFRQITPVTKVVLLPQSYLQIDPGIMLKIIRMTGAQNPLVILDEINFAQEPFRRRIKVGALRNFIEILKSYIKCNSDRTFLKEYLFNLELLVSAPTSDLRSSGWTFPLLDADVAAELQELGMRIYGDGFYFPGYDLTALSMQHPGYRQRISQEEIEFRCLPKLDKKGKLLVLSGTASKPLLEHRLGVEFKELFADYRFRNEGSRFYNINIGNGIGRYHKDHLPRLVDFAVQFQIRKMLQNQSMVIVTKKCFVTDTIELFNQALDAASLKNVRAVPADEWHEDENTLLIPVLHYGGAIGFNALENIESIVCLAGYYIRTTELNRMVNEVSSEDVHVSYRIETRTNPLRRVAVSTARPEDRSAYLDQLAQEVLQQEEMGTVIQAIGRVRPFTTPREVVTCQCGESPLMSYDKEFKSLEEAREYFDLQTAKTRMTRKTWVRVQWLKRQGCTQRHVAEKLRVHLRTATTYWR